MKQVFYGENGGDYNMASNIYQSILFGVVLYSIASMMFACIFNLDMTTFDPTRNYEKWKNFNWVGVWAGTIFLHIIYLPLAICYWVYRLLTVGRK